MDLLQVNAASAAPYGEPLLHKIDFRLPAGKVLGLIGPNGCGKSTLLHTIAGGISLDTGSIELQGKPLRAWPQLERARSLAMQVQHAALNFPFTVEEVVLLGRIPHASGASCDHQIVQEVLAATDTLSLCRRPYTQLSGGEKQRVQLARAVAQVWRSEDAPARLLLLDEPNSALDLAHQRMVLDLVARLARDGCAVILATHDFNLLSAHADSLLVLQDGRQHSFGAPPEVISPEMFAQVFGVEVLVQNHPTSGRPMVIQA
jgi:heme transport system ATP-binding protein